MVLLELDEEKITDLEEHCQNYHCDSSISRNFDTQDGCNDQPDKEEKQYAARFDHKTASSRHETTDGKGRMTY